MVAKNKQAENMQTEAQQAENRQTENRQTENRQAETMRAEIENVTRRGFLGAGSAIALTLAYRSPAWARSVAEEAAAAVPGGDATSASFEPNVFISVATENASESASGSASGSRVTLTIHRSEMGQGIRSALAMILADELCVDIDEVMIEQADGHEKYGDQNTDGSKSIRTNLEPLRKAGAAAREMFTVAAANRWSVPAGECSVALGVVSHEKSGRSLKYGELVADAAALDVPADPKLLDRSAFRYIGKPRANWDVEDFVVGKGTFGIDVRLDNMVFASIERSPTVSGKVKSFDATAAKAVRGVKSVHQIEPNVAAYKLFGSVAVVATSTWAAMKGRKALEIEWDRGSGSENSAEYRTKLDELVEGDGKVFREEGDYAAAKASAARVMSAKYHGPYLVHAPMEPLAATALVTDTSCEIWAPTQDPQTARKRTAQILGMKPEQVTVHVTFLGGAFGRKSKPDFIFEAALIAKEMPGTPVKVTWTREDEVRHGYYRAQNAQKLEATLDADNNVTGWRHHTAFPTIMSTFMATATEPSEFEAGQGVGNMPYLFPAVKLEKSGIASDLRIGWMRSVCNTFHAHSINCFVDELAEASKMDPVAFRLKMLGDERRVLKLSSRDKPYGQDTARLRHVIEKCAELSNWGKTELPDGVGHGFASHFSFLTYVAMAMQASVEDGKARVHQVDCVVDCGTFVNPETVRSQIEGAVVFGLSFALYGSITAKDGAVVESNFHNYPVLRIDEMPRVNVHLVENTEPPAGVGEPGVPPVAPALANALYAATGKRYRDLPLVDQLS